jgi:trigger factor
MNSKTAIKSTLSWQDKATFVLKITIPVQKIKKARQEAVKELAKAASMPGFRKGKAPAELIEKKVNQDQLFQKILEKIVPEAYLESIKQHGLTPIIEPKITLEKVKEGEAWIIKAVACQYPEVNLDNYKEAVRKLNAGKKIWTPGKEKKLEEETKSNEEQLQKIIELLLKKIKVKVPQIIIEKEVEDKLISLVDQLQKTGLTLEQYLARTGKSLEAAKEEYKKQAEEKWSLEFILTKIADQEKIQVSDNEIKAVLEKQQSQSAQQINPYLLAQLLRRQKTLEYLMAL